MSTIGSVGCVIVWASQCLAYIRCWLWFRHHSKQGNLPRKYDRWRNHWDPSYMSTFSYLQPFPAIVGLICCCLIIFVFSTATWWNGNISFRKVATAYAGVSLPSSALYPSCENGTPSPAASFQVHLPTTFR